MASSLAWLADYADHLLKQPQPAYSPSPTDPTTSDQPHPLAVLLLWLDCLSFLANSTPQPTPASEEPAPAEQAEASLLEHDRPASRSGRAQGSISSQSDSIDEFVAYLTQVYLGSGDPALWPSPLTVGPLAEASGESGVIGGAGGTDLAAARTRISHWASGAQAWLGADSPQTEGSASAPSTTLLASLPDSSHLLPPPLGPTLLATIASTLASSRQKQPARRPPTLTFRWTLSTILNHYFPHKFGQQMEDGVITYARDPASDEALQSYHERISHMRFSSGEDDEPTTPLDFEADRAEGIRAATLSIAKRDEKMRWLLGENFQNRSMARTACRSHDRPATIVTFPDPSRNQDSDSTLDSPNKLRRLSLSSLNSAVPEPSHSRSVSAASSRAPLLHPESPTSPRGLMHRRGISVPGLGTNYDIPALSPSAPFSNFDTVPVSPTDKRIGTPVGGQPASPTYVRPPQGGAAISVPPPRNALSQDEKRDLVKRSKKLEQMFGVPLEEAAAERVLVGGQPLDGQDPNKLQTTPTRPGKARRRSASFPPPSPTSASFDDGHFFLDASPSSSSTSKRLTPPNLNSTGMVRSVSSPNSTSPITDDVFLPDTPTLPNAIHFSALGGNAALQKEERRRKLAKLQRLLGERVPTELVLNEAPGRGLSPGSHGMGRSGSRLGGMFKGKLGFGQAREEHAKRDEGFVVVDQAALVAAEQQQLAAQASTSTAPIKGLARARKLEQLFGDLPPPNLYRDHAGQLAPGPLHRVSSTASSARSIHSFRTSIASLQYLAEQDPAGLDRITEEYASTMARPAPAAITVEEPSPTLSQGTDDEDEHEGEQAVRAAAEGVGRRESAQSAGSAVSHRRTIKKAQKLASFFGTTRGEVWGLLLDDLEAAIVEEEGLDEEERAEVLGGVHRLRQTAV